jgi:hypothetical protein
MVAQEVHIIIARQGTSARDVELNLMMSFFELLSFPSRHVRFAVRVAHCFRIFTQDKCTAITIVTFHPRLSLNIFSLSINKRWCTPNAILIIRIIFQKNSSLPTTQRDVCYYLKYFLFPFCLSDSVKYERKIEACVGLQKNFHSSAAVHLRQQETRDSFQFPILLISEHYIKLTFQFLEATFHL